MQKHGTLLGALISVESPRRQALYVHNWAEKNTHTHPGPGCLAAMKETSLLESLGKSQGVSRYLQ